MIMKTKPIFVIAFLLMATLQLSAFSATATEGDPVRVPLTEVALKTAIVDLEARAERLREAKKNATTRAEKQQIRAEIRGIKKEAKQLKQQASGGIYIGGGALLVIIVLLILLL